MKFFLYLILTLYIKPSRPLPTPTSTHPSTGVIEPHNIEHIKPHNNTPANEEDHPKHTENPHNPEVKEAEFEFHGDLTEDDEEYHKPTTENIPQLRMRCSHLYRLLYPNRPQEFLYKPSNYDQYTDEHRPIYVTTPKPTVRPTYPSTNRPSSFYITVPTVNTRGPLTGTSSIKYIRLEPVILQKTILSNGRTVYYWHKSLPTAVEYPQKYLQNENSAKEESYQGGYDNGYNPFYSYYYNPNFYASPNGGYYYPGSQNVGADRRPLETTTEASTTTTTEESGYSYGLSNFIPFYASSISDSTTTTTEPPTTITTRPLDKGTPEDLPYSQQLKFVIPVPYDDGLTRPTWGYNQNPYYQKGVQNNYRVPYGPSFQIVRAVAIPKLEDKVNERIDETSK